MEDNFEKKMRQTMGNPPDYPFDDGMWSAMDERLQKKPRKGVVGLWAWLPYAMLLLLGIGTGYLYYLLNENRTQLSNLEKLVSEKNPTIAHNIKHQTTYVFDTIHKKIVLTEYQNSVSQRKMNDSRFFDKWSDLSRSSAMLRKGLLDENNQISDGFISALEPNKKGVLMLSKLANPQSSSYLPGLSSRTKSKGALDLLVFDIGLDYARNFDLPSLLPALAIKKIFLNKVINASTPDSYALSAHVGSFATLNLPQSGISNYGIGFDGALQMNEQWSLLVGGEFLVNNFKQEFEPGQTLDAGLFPILPPTTVGDELHEVYGDFQYLQIPFGIHYSLKKGGKLKPYIGAGVTAISAIKSNVKYEYIGSGGEYDLESSDLLASAFQLSNGWGSVGLSYDWKERWAFIAEVSSQFDISNAARTFGFEENNFLKLIIGSRYQF